MSTAGKVLTVLILLVTLVWVVMASAVSELNTNWEEKIQAQQKTLDDTTAEAEKAKDDSMKLTDQARAKQDETDRELRVRLIRISAAERLRSATIENLTRLKAQVDDAEASVRTATANLATREAEKISNQEELAKKLDEIAKSKATNAELRNQLAQLQDSFKKLLTENAERLAKASRAGAAKPASNVRPAPSS